MALKLNFIHIAIVAVVIIPVNGNGYGQSSQVHVESSLGHSIENATVIFKLSDSQSYQGTMRPDREINLNHIGDGKYAPAETIILDNTYDVELLVSAPDHEPASRLLYGVTGNHNVELFHNNYYKRCNELNSGSSSSSFLPWNQNPWDDCEVNKNDLIEIFGIEEKNIVNPGDKNYLFNMRLFKYAPDISNDYSQFAPRFRAYRTIFDNLLISTSLSLATVQNQELIEWVESELESNQVVSNSEMVVKGASLVTNFSESFKIIDLGLQAAGYALDIGRAKREGSLEGLLMYIAYRGVVEEVLQRIEKLSGADWLKDDEALKSAVSDARSDYERLNEKSEEEMIQGIITQRVGDVLGDIILGEAIKGSLTSAGVAVSSLVGGKAAPVLLAAGGKTIAAYVIYDFLESVRRTGDQRALLSAIVQMDKHMFHGVPDHFESSVSKTLNPQQHLDMLMRMQLGLLFNEARAALFAGEFRTWIGYQFQYSKKGARNANQAYDLKMADVSLKKAESAQKDIESLISLMLGTKSLETVDTDATFDAETVYGTYRRFLNGEPDIHSANLKVLPGENGKAIIHGYAFYHPRRDTTIAPNIGQFKKRAVLGRINNLEDELGCSLRIEFKDERMIVEEMNKGIVSSCGGNNVTFQGEYLKEKQATDKENITSIPSISTSSILSINENSAQSSGEVTTDGGATVTARGVCWSTSRNPTISDDCSSNGSGTGNFTTSITNLSSGTQYYVRAYATNSEGTAYGQQRNFTTNSASDEGDWPRDTTTKVVDVTNPATGRTWMDRNLGASRAATSSTDSEAYGDLYQWGRAADGHENRNSGTISANSRAAMIEDGKFKTSSGQRGSVAYFDWRRPQNDNLWQGVNGKNNPCPDGYRLPTEAEWTAERQSWSRSGKAGAFASPLKLPVPGYRTMDNGSLDSVGSRGYYWSSTVSGTRAWKLDITSRYHRLERGSFRVSGFSVRCIKD